MEISEKIIKRPRIKLILWVFCIMLIFPPLFIISYTEATEAWIYFAISISLGFILYIINTILTAKPYDWPNWFFMLILAGFYLKRNHLPPAGIVLTVGTLCLSILSLWNSGRFVITFRNNPFLKLFGSLSGIIITIFMTGLLFMNQRWSGLVRVILTYSGSFLFIIFTLGFIFTLPNSNYIAWSGIERKVFFRTILLPMVFVFALITLIFVFPDTYDSILGRGVFSSPWFDNLYETRLFDLEGMPAL